MLRLLITFFILTLQTIAASSQGLSFCNPENSIENRTSFNVFAHKQKQFDHYLDITFKMQLPLDDVIGYIVRVIDKPSGHIYNLFFDGRGADYFSLNEEGYKTLIKYHFNRDTLRSKQWFDVNIKFDFDNKSILFAIDNQLQMAENIDIPNNMMPHIIFGQSDYLIDVPSFTMRDLIISDNKQLYNFPLQQVSGNDVYTNDGKMLGYVHNPYWAINDAYHWKKVYTSASKTPASHAYSATKHEIYYFNRDSLYSYKIMTQKTKRIAFSERCPLEIYIGTSFIDNSNEKLYAYETFREKKKEKETSVASLNLNNLEWQNESDAQINEGQMHHHGAYFDESKQEYTIYGGFANMAYHSKFYRYSIKNHWWGILDVEGSAIPRYFCSMGYDSLRYVYIFGGMGNESGDQTVGRMFFYDLHQLDTQTNKIKKLWTANWSNKTNIVFVKNMIIKDNYFYTLGFSEFLSDSYLKLYKFSLTDGSYTQIGDSISIHPNRIETDANLYYDPLLHMFIATVQEYTDKEPSIFSAYIINAPVLSETQFEKACQLPPNYLPWYIATTIILFITIVIATLIIFRRYKNKRTTNLLENRKVIPFTSKPNAIYIFGKFQTFDNQNHNISHLFTEQLRYILCLLIQYNDKGGLSSHDLGNIIWGDKEPEKIKNSKSVAINYLRRILNDIDGIKVIYQNKKFLLNIEEPFYCDYLQLMQLIKTDETIDNNSNEILHIVSFGKFMAFIDIPTFDIFKSEVESKLLNALTRILNNAIVQNDIPKTLDCIQQIFVIDPTNEDAYKTQIKTLKKLGNDLACIEAKLRFTENYKQYYGTNYQDSI